MQQKILVTGGKGTVGKVLHTIAEQAGHLVTNWDRRTVSYGDEPAMIGYLDKIAPDVVINLAIASRDDPQSIMGPQSINEDLPAVLGVLCERRGIRFLHTSSVMVFEESGNGPFTADSVAAAATGYGKEKRLGEQKLLAQCSQAIIARLGWQIGNDLAGNTMSHYLAKAMADKQEIVASNRWIPACSFVADTAAALLRLALSQPNQRGIFHIDGNRGWSFFEIASALKAYFNECWVIRQDDAFVFDQRLLEDWGDLADLCDISRTLGLRRV